MFLSAAQENLVPPLELVKLVDTYFADEALKAHLLLVLRRLHPRDLNAVSVSALYPPLGRVNAVPASDVPFVQQQLDDLIDVVLGSLKATSPEAVQRELCYAAVAKKEPLLAAFGGLYSSDKTTAACAWIYAALDGIASTKYDFAKSRDPQTLIDLFGELTNRRLHAAMLVSGLSFSS